MGERNSISLGFRFILIFLGIPKAVGTVFSGVVCQPLMARYMMPQEGWENNNSLLLAMPPDQGASRKGQGG
jgi:hypothetical protein